MKILSIETTSGTASISLLEDNEIKSELSFKCPDIASRLSGYTEYVLGSNGCNPEELDLIVISRGPGLWTGTRIGMGFAKGLASARNTAIFCVDTPGSLFYGMKEIKIPLLCLVNASRERMYVSYFNGRFDWKRAYPVKTMTYDRLYRFCSKKNLYLTGPGTSVLPRHIMRMKTVTVSAGHSCYPRSGINALLALEKIRRNVSSLPLEPFYGK